MRPLPVLLASGLLASTSLLTGCGDDDPEPEPLGSGDDYSVLNAIGELPRSVGSDAPMIVTADLDRATEVAGLERPGDPGSDEVMNWMTELTATTRQGGEQVFVPMPDELVPYQVRPADMDEQVGWSVVDVATYASVSGPPESFLVVSGDFDGETLSSDLAEVDDDIVTDVEAEDHEQNVQEPTAFSRLGAPTRLAEDDGRIAASSTTDAVRDWLDGEGDSYGDDADFAEVAKALDGQDVYSAVIAPAPSGVDPAALILGTDSPPEAVDRVRDLIEGQLPEASYDVVGIGWAQVDDGPLITTAYHFGSDDDAEDSVDSLRELYESGESVRSRQPYSDFIEVEDVEADGSTVVVTTRPAGDAPISFPFRALTERDLLFVSR